MKNRMIAAAIFAGVLAAGAGLAEAQEATAAPETAKPVSTAVGLRDGWTTAKPWMCGLTNEGNFVVYLDYTAKRRLHTNDPNLIATLPSLCANGKAFLVFVKGGMWRDTSFSSQYR